MQSSRLRKIRQAFQSAKVWVTLGAALIGGGCWLLLGSASEPRYEGRSLSQWLEPTFRYDYRNHTIVSAPSARFQTAIQAMGADAIPHLLRMLAAREYPYSSLLMDWFGNVNNPWANRIGLNRPWFRRTRAAKAFVALGGRATNAIPALLKTGASGEMVEALNGIGSAGFPVVLGEIEKGDETVRFNGLFALQAKAYDRNAAAGIWIRYTRDPSPHVRWAATTLLWAAPKESRETVLATLKQRERDADPKVAAMAKLTSQRIASIGSELENTLVP